MLTTIIKIVLLIGLVFITFGPNYSYSLIRIVLGEKWSETEAPTFFFFFKIILFFLTIDNFLSLILIFRVLSWYCCYILTMALNGVTEGLFFRKKFFFF